MIQFTQATIDTYDRMFDAFQNGYITAREWVEFCHAMMDITLMKNQAMLYRMKHNITTHIQGNTK